MALDYEGVNETESPTGTDSSPAVDPTSSAGTQNTDPTTGQPLPGRQGNWLPQERAEEMAQRRVERALEQQRSEFSREREQLLQSFDQRSQQSQQALLQGLQQRANQPSRTAEEEAQRRQAIELLQDIQPGLKALPALGQGYFNLQKQSEQFAQELAQLKEARAQDFTSGEQGRLQQFAGQAGLSFANGQQFAQFEDYVAGVIRGNPQAHAAFVAGNRAVLPWAFGIARQQMAAPLQAERARLAETKTNTGRLPPTHRGGGVPGSAPTMPKFNPDNPHAFQRDLSAQARAFLLERTGQS